MKLLNLFPLLLGKEGVPWQGQAPVVWLMSISSASCRALIIAIVQHQVLELTVLGVLPKKVPGPLTSGVMSKALEVSTSQKLPLLLDQSHLLEFLTLNVETLCVLSFLPLPSSFASRRNEGHGLSQIAAPPFLLSLVCR